MPVSPGQAAAYRLAEDQLKGARVLPLHTIMVLPFGTRRSDPSTVYWIRITLAITWPQGVLSEEENLTAAAQVMAVLEVSP